MKKILWISLLFAIFGALGFGFKLGYDYLKAFRPAFNEGDIVITYANESFKPKLLINNTSKLADFYQFVIAEVVKAPKNETELYSIKIIENYGAAGIRVDEVINLESKALIGYSTEIEKLKKIDAQIKDVRSKMAFSRIKDLKERISRLLITLEGDDYKMDKNEEAKYIDGSFLGPDVLIITRVKKVLSQIIESLSEVYKIHINYYKDYSELIIPIDEILDAEVSLRGFSFGETHDGLYRILNYLKHAKVGDDKIMEYAEKFLSSGLTLSGNSRTFPAIVGANNISITLDLEPNYKLEDVFSPKYLETDIIKKYSKIVALADQTYFEKKELLGRKMGNLKSITSQGKILEARMKRSLEAKEYANDFPRYLNSRMDEMGLKEVSADKFKLSYQQIQQMKDNFNKEISEVDAVLADLKAQLKANLIEKQDVCAGILTIINELKIKAFDSSLVTKFIEIEVLFESSKVDLAWRKLREVTLHTLKINTNEFRELSWWKEMERERPRDCEAIRLMCMEESLSYEKLKFSKDSGTPVK